MSVKDVNIKKLTYYFFNNIIHIKNKKSYKNVLIYYIGYMTIKKDLKIYSGNPLYIIFDKVDGYLKETNGTRYLTLVPANESTEKIKNMKNYGIKSKI